MVKSAGNPNALLPAVRNLARTLDPAMAIYNEETMEEHVRTAYFLPRLAATLFGAFGCIGLVLAAVGLYGVMSYSVSRRMREIGIRMALGAKPGSVERLVLRQGLVLTLDRHCAWLAGRMDAGEDGFQLSLRHSAARCLDVFACSSIPCPGRFGGLLLPCTPRGLSRADASIAH